MRQRFFLVRVAAVEVSREHLLPDEQDLLTVLRWKTLEEIRDTDAVIFPPGLADLLTPILARNPGRTNDDRLRFLKSLRLARFVSTEMILFAIGVLTSSYLQIAYGLTTVFATIAD